MGHEPGCKSNSVESFATMNSKCMIFACENLGKAQIVNVKWRRLKCQRTLVAGRVDEHCDKKVVMGEFPLSRE